MKKVLLVLSIVFVLTFAMATVAYATGASAAPAPAPTNSVSQVIQDGFDEVKVQAKEIVFNVVVWALLAADIVFILYKGVAAFISYRQGAGVNALPIIGGVVVLILLLIIPEALWALLG